MQKIDDLETLRSFLASKDNTVNNVYFSDVPQVCKDFPCILGIDEAGRGPVLGPMVYGTAFCPLNEATLPDSLGCADSKALNEESRDVIFSKICANRKMGWGVEVIAPNSICNSMLSRQKYSLNQVSMDAAINLIKMALKGGVNLSHVYVDTVGPPEKYQAYLKSLFPNVGVTVAKKADSTFPIVSAASICAKVTRDYALKGWGFGEGLQAGHEEFGSGYPGDPNTKKFLQNYRDPVFGYPHLVRFSWSTASEALKEAYHVDWEENEEVIPIGNTSITEFFKMTKNRGARSLHDFFTTRCLSRKVEF
ncbi:ribonuclease H2 subunit A [Tribolium castaneum]|uniref:Ribonuclease n=1 Tax=Tribolium castaneum TaxID=7070 RepID=D6X470_TRICA|nr:PREDICTED: ribonuclease H2 subunit A [Tribolium castaneum]EEZ97514.1 Ribonuclease H2 subunit A-like Protein [Tribolium castaneum]|eukprot:XP_966789.1 PREDICTED: ribonuclease H2 subunit A [Tribolium castaneum]